MRSGRAGHVIRTEKHKTQEEYQRENESETGRFSCNETIKIMYNPRETRCEDGRFTGDRSDDRGQ